MISSSSHELVPLSKPTVLIMLGPPGSGKGTQATMLQKKLQIPHISTGDLLREHVRNGTILGKEAIIHINNGTLVPDHLILDMLFERVSQEDCTKGYILDGFPRTLPQAEALEARLKEQVHLTVINLDLKDAIIIERLTKRVVCEKCGAPYHLLYSPPKQEGVCDKCQGPLIHRSDDNEATITKRLKVYHDQTSPLIAYYHELKRLHTVNCNKGKEEIFSEVLSYLPLSS